MRITDNFFRNHFTAPITLFQVIATMVRVAAVPVVSSGNAAVVVERAVDPISLARPSLAVSSADDSVHLIISPTLSPKLERTRGPCSTGVHTAVVA